MSKDVLAHAIEPFYTTRQDQGGTGLGLSIVYGFMRQTGGNLHIESAVDLGTEVVLTLPLASLTAGSVEKRGVRGKALLVEDDPETRAALHVLLETLGFDVTALSNGLDARTSLHQTKFDVLLSDLDLGGEIDGLGVIETARTLSPGTKAILMSGKSVNDISAHIEPTFIAKPVTHSKLLDALPA